MMGTRLRDLIRSVRACKTAAEERAVIAKECAALRTSFKENDQDFRHRNVAKLMFIHMLGYPTHFGQMECLKLIASPGFPEKRIGYLGLMLLLDERQEVLMLVTNSLKNDLNHGNQFICGLALCALGDICSSEMARDLAPEVERLLNSNNSYIRKKAALTSIRILRKVPDLSEYLLGPATGLLLDKHHGVLLGGVRLAHQLCLVSPQAVDHFRKQTPTLVRILKNLVVSGYAPEYDVGGVTDPFLQIRVLRLLRLLGKGDAECSDIMSDVLAQVATNTESNKNSGNAILYECVSTIFGIEAIGGLRVLAINILGRFLTNRDNNIRYVALHTLAKVVNVDTQAVQRHRNTIVECVKDADISIRRRALDLVYSLVNESNITQLTKELLDFLRVADTEFKPDLTAKICALVQRFAPNKVYHVEITLRVLVEAGKYVTDDVINFLVVLISNTPQLQGFAARAFYRALQSSWDGQESLGVVALWCIGEYGELLVNQTDRLEGEEAFSVTESQVLSLVTSTLKGVHSTPTLNGYALTALLKLANRFPSSASQAQALIDGYKGSLQLELQQRSVEFGSVLTRHQNIRATLVDKMPALDEATYRAKHADLGASAAGSDLGSISSSSFFGASANGGAAQVAKPAPAAAALADLLDLSADDTPAPAAAAAGGFGGVPSGPSTAAGDLLDMLGGDSFAPAPAAASSTGANLLDFLSRSDPAPATFAPGPAAAPSSLSAPAASVDPLADLFGGGSAPTPIAAVQPRAIDPLQQLGGGFGAAPSAATAVSDPFGDFGMAPAPTPGAPAFLPIVAFAKDGLTVHFDFLKPNPVNPAETTVTARYDNASPFPLTDFVFQAAVPKFMQLRLEPASSSLLPASSVGSVSQVLHVTNTMHGQKPLVMKLRISYKLNGQDVLEQAQVGNFPPNL